MSEAKYIHGTQEAERRRLSTFNQLVNPSFLSFLQVDSAKSVLEVGSGLGLLTREVALRLPEAEVVGIEYSEAQLARADHGLPNLRFFQGDAHDLDFEDNYFDVVYCRWVLEHVADPLRVLQEMRRVARPDGRVFVEEVDTAAQCYDPPVPRFEKVWGQVAVLQQKLGGDSLIGRRLFRLLKVAGFTDVRLSMGTEVYWSGTPGLTVWVNNEAAIVEGCRSELVSRGLVSQAEIEEAIAELRGLCERDDATSWYYWNRAVALKPR